MLLQNLGYPGTYRGVVQVRQGTFCLSMKVVEYFDKPVACPAADTVYCRVRFQPTVTDNFCQGANLLGDVGMSIGIFHWEAQYSSARGILQGRGVFRGWGDHHKCYDLIPN